jgi:CRP-like cAMP-binding protein
MSELDAIQASLASFTKRLDEVSDHADTRTFSAGDCLTTEGDDMNTFFVFLFGTATVYHHKKVVGTIRSGECIGEGMFFANENLSRSATVIADNQVIAAEIQKTGIDLLHGEPKAYLDKALLLALFKKLQGANRKIEELLR